MPSCPSCIDLRAELASVQAALDLEVSRRTLGGTQLKATPGWASIALPPPPSATDDSMPAHRRVGMARSTDQRGQT
jgi:hypothetical protein